MTRLSELIYSHENVSGEAIKKLKSHLPRIEAPDTVRVNEEFTVKISVGPHPSTGDHSIRWIDVYVYEKGREFNPIHVARVVLEPEYSVPKIVLTLRLKRDSVVYALAYCNKHGVWENRKEIKVV